MSEHAGIPAWPVQNAVPGAAWPALPTPDGAAVLGVLLQLDRSQWLPPAELEALQMLQLEALLRHAFEQVPEYRERWAGAYDPQQPLTLERFRRLPRLTRRDLQQAGGAMRAASVPAAHGVVFESSTSGSTGVPVKIAKTALSDLFWKTFSLRDHLWHRRELGGKLAAIRSGAADTRAGHWGTPAFGIVVTGEAVMRSTATDVAAQLDWLSAERPNYLLVYATNALELARLAIARGVRLPSLREVRTFGEMLRPETRAAVREAWGVPVCDTYSAAEAGVIALQCPEHEHYHVQAEGVLVEVLDDAGAPCAPGQTGRVVLTPLHNFATPLVRSELGDFAEVGERCACGRGLPVLRRIAGRQRNTLLLRDGRRYWPYFGGSRAVGEAAPVVQYQLVQRDYELIEMRIVPGRPFTPEDEARLRDQLLSNLPAGLRIEFSYHQAIARGAGRKFEDFVSEVAEA